MDFSREPDIASFSVDSDYQDGEWIDGEFYYSAERRKPRRFTKEDAIYGVFGYDGDDAEQDQYDQAPTSRSGGSSTSSAAAAAIYSRGVNFVSSHTIGGDQPQSRVTVDDDDDDDDGGAHSGLGSGGSGKKRSKRERTPEEQEERRRRRERRRQEKQRREAARQMPSSFGKRATARSTTSGSSSSGSSNATASISTASVASTSESDVAPAAWERHTKGIGSKLLAKMGYTGGGLGREGSGIAKPIETKLRPNRMGLAFGDFKEASAPVLPRASNPKLDAEDLAKKDDDLESDGSDLSSSSDGDSDVEKSDGWKRTSKKKPKTKYEIPASFDGPTNQLIVDMRGREQRVLSSFQEAENLQQVSKGKCPELMYNVRTLVDKSLIEIQNIDRKIAWEKDQSAILTREKQSIQRIAADEESRLTRLIEIQSILTKCEQRLSESSTNPISIEMLADIFAVFRRNYSQEYVAYNLAALAVQMITPKLKAQALSWHPLQHPEWGAKALLRWKELLLGDTQLDADVDESRREEQSPLLAASHSNAFSRMLEDVIFPRIRRSLYNEWNPKEPDTAVRLLETWKPVFAKRTMVMLIDQVLLPKLTSAVEDWSPKQELPAHLWLHPWLPLLGSKLSPVYPLVRQKLGTALAQWKASDESAKAVLTPWRKVFDRASWDALLARTVVPQLAQELRALVINPAQQQMEGFYRVMEWEELLSVKYMESLLDNEFFPKWLHVLGLWLQNNPNYDELVQWYLGWKKSFSARLIGYEGVRAQFNQALDLISESIQA